MIDPDGTLNLGDAEFVERSYGCECGDCMCGASHWDPECYCDDQPCVCPESNLGQSLVPL